MAVRELLQIPDPLLKTVCRQVDLDDPQLRIMAEDLRDTYLHLAELRAPLGLMTGGIAANQLGYNARMIILHVGPESGYPHSNEVIINPLLTRLTDEVFDFFSGCGSVPKNWARVESPKHVQIRGILISGGTFLQEYHGSRAAVAYHETNHLDGKTILDVAKEIYADQVGAEFVRSNGF